MTPRPITADMVACAIVAAAKEYGDSPVRAMEAKAGLGRRCVAPAIIGLAQGLGAPLYGTAERLGFRYSGIERARSQGAPVFARAVTAAEQAVRRLASVTAAPVEPALNLAAARELVPLDPATAASIVASVVPGGKAVDAPRELKSRARQLPRGTRFEDIGGGVQVIRMKPVTDKILQRAKDWIARGMEIDELADMFDVSPDSLERKLSEAGVKL